MTDKMWVLELAVALAFAIVATMSAIVAHGRAGASATGAGTRAIPR